MKLRNCLYISIAVLGLAACSDWTETEREMFPEQEEMTRYIPLIEAQGEEDLMPSQREYYRKLREYRNTPHVKGFGWYGNWTGKGTNAQNYLKMLPDSVDFVSLWGIRGNLSAEQKADLQFFQEVKGGKVLLCWGIYDIGSGITPKGKDAYQYWVTELGKGDEVQGSIAFASAICDTIEKYNLDGFDIDYEPNYGAPGNLATKNEISEEQNENMQAFIETMSARLRPAGRMLVMDGEPNLLSTETSKLIDYYIYQAYWETSTQAVINKISQPKLDNWERKTIIAAEFEQGWRCGGIHPDNNSDKPEANATYSPKKDEFRGKKGAQIFDYATLDLPSGRRIGGIGAYHLEYDYSNDPSYKWLRTALYYGNQVYPGKFE